MPQASEQDRQWVRAHFGSTDVHGVQKELEARGFHLTKEWCWKRSRIPNDFEWRCINFLVEEWDYGGYVED